MRSSMRSVLRVGPIVAALVVLAGCDGGSVLSPSEATPGGADALGSAAAAASSYSEAGRSGGGGGSAPPLFEQLAARIDGFAGLYRRDRCAVVVVLTRGADRENALLSVRAAITPLVDCPDGLRVGAALAQFTYRELRGYLASARPLAGIPGVTGARIDFQLNRLVIQVTSRETANAVLMALPRVGIPSGAVTFQPAPTQPVTQGTTGAPRGG
jgi:hypothetical protein